MPFLKLKNISWLLILTNISFSQNITNFFFNGNGARAVGMGNAYTAVAEDATAISWNSAGLTSKRYAQATVVGRFGNSSVNISGFQDFGIDAWDVTTDIYSQINYVGFTYPLNFRKIKTTVGIAYRRIHDFSHNEINKLSGPLFGDPSGSLETNNNSGGGLGAFALAGGFRLHKMFSVGATLNFYSGKKNSYTTYTLNGETQYDKSIGYEQKYTGFGADIGLMFKPIKSLSIGANIVLPHSLETTGDSLNKSLDIPTFYTIGIAYRPTKKLLFAFDYRPQPLGDITINGEKSDAENIYSLHFGLLYKVVSGKKLYPLRFGYYMNSESNDALNADNVYTGGVTFPFQNFSVDLGFEFARTSFTKEDDINGNPYTGDYSSKDFRMTIGFSFDLVRR